MKTLRALPFFVLASILLVACGDAVVGKWEAPDAVTCFGGGTDRVAFEVFHGGTGRGDVCGCDFDFKWTDEGDGEYEIEIDYELGCWSFDRVFTCSLESDDSILDCGNLGEYERAD